MLASQSEDGYFETVVFLIFDNHHLSQLKNTQK